MDWIRLFILFIVVAFAAVLIVLVSLIYSGTYNNTNAEYSDVLEDAEERLNKKYADYRELCTEVREFVDYINDINEQQMVEETTLKELLNELEYELRERSDQYFTKEAGAGATEYLHKHSYNAWRQLKICKILRDVFSDPGGVVDKLRKDQIKLKTSLLRGLDTLALDKENYLNRVVILLKESGSHHQVGNADVTYDLDRALDCAKSYYETLFADIDDDMNTLEVELSNEQANFSKKAAEAIAKIQIANHLDCPQELTARPELVKEKILNYFKEYGEYN